MLSGISAFNYSENLRTFLAREGTVYLEAAWGLMGQHARPLYPAFFGYGFAFEEVVLDYLDGVRALVGC